jgi:hypothetical protein
MRELINFIALLTSLMLTAQIKSIGEIDVTNYPSVKFKIQTRTFENLNDSNFSFTELINSKEKSLTSFSIKLSDFKALKKEDHKCVLIMIEALSVPSRHEQVDAFFYGIKNSLKDFVKKGDKIKIVAFALRKGNTKIINNVNQNFTDNINELKKGIDDYKIASTVFNNKDVSDLYGAVFEGLEMLDKESTSLQKSILLLSEERNNKFSTQKSSLNVISLAKEKNIIINTIKYNRANYEQYSDPTLSTQTYGESHVLKRSLPSSSNPNKQKAIEILVPNILNDIVNKANGKIYDVTLNLIDDSKNGKSHTILINQLKGEFQTKIVFSAPGNFIYFQFQKNLLFALSIAIIIIVLLVLLIRFFYNKYKKNQLVKKSDELKKLKILEEQDLAIQKQELEINLIKSNEMHRLKNEQESKEEEQRVKSDKLIIEQMKAIGSFPILKYKDSNNSSQFEINLPKVTFGRDSKNLIQINNNNLSRNHFCIIFENNEYKILDNNSTNGIIINGYKLKEAILKHGDIIEIADMNFSFYK